MNVEQIIKMIDAGYTKEEIEKMNHPVEEKQEKSEEPQTEKQEKAAEAKTEPQKENQEPVNNEMLQELRDLKKAVYAMNIMQSSQPPKSASVDDILAKALKEE